MSCSETRFSAALFAVRAVSGQTAVLPIRLMNSRRLMGFTPVAENHLRESLIRSSNESYAAHRSKTGRPMSALGQKQTKCDAAKNYVYSITSSAVASSD